MDPDEAVIKNKHLNIVFQKILLDEGFCTEVPGMEFRVEEFWVSKKIDKHTLSSW